MLFAYVSFKEFFGFSRFLLLSSIDPTVLKSFSRLRRFILPLFSITIQDSYNIKKTTKKAVSSGNLICIAFFECTVVFKNLCIVPRSISGHVGSTWAQGQQERVKPGVQCLILYIAILVFKV